MSCVYCHSLWISLIYDVAEGRKVIRTLILTVHAVIDGNEADAHLREPDFRVKPYLQIVTAKPGHILDHNHTDQSGLNVPQHFLEPRTLEAGAGVPVVLVNLVVGDAVVSGVLGQDFDLRCNV